MLPRMEACPDCKGVGTLAREPLLDGKPNPASAFARLCDRCSGSGEVRAEAPRPEESAPTMRQQQIAWLKIARGMKEALARQPTQDIWRKAVSGPQEG